VDQEKHDEGPAGINPDVPDRRHPVRDKLLMELIRGGIKTTKGEGAPDNPPTRDLTLTESERSEGGEGKHCIYSDMRQLAKRSGQTRNPRRRIGLKERQYPSQNPRAVLNGSRVARQQKNGGTRQNDRQPTAHQCSD